MDDTEADATLFDDLSFGEAAEYVEVPAGEYTLGVRPADDESALVECFDVAVEDGGVYTAFAAGYLRPEEAAADEPFDLVVAEDADD